MYSIVNHLNDVNCLVVDASRFEMQPGEEHMRSSSRGGTQGGWVVGGGLGVTCATSADTRILLRHL